MHNQPSGFSRPTDTTRERTADPNQVEGAILALLLGEDHHGLWSREELQRYMSASPLDVIDAIAELIANGLVHDLHGFLLASRAARSFDRLEL